MKTLTYLFPIAQSLSSVMKIGFERHIVIQEKSAKMRYLPRPVSLQPGTNE